MLSPRRSGAPTRCLHHISGTISSPFRGAFHLSLTVLSAIDLSICLALDGGPPGFGPDFTCPTLLRNPPPCVCISSTGLSPSMADFSKSFAYTFAIGLWRSYNPHEQAHGFGLLPFRSPLLGQSLKLISFPLLLRCFSSQSIPPSTLLDLNKTIS
jgi:hypothetical protein